MPPVKRALTKRQLLFFSGGFGFATGFTNAICLSRYQAFGTMMTGNLLMMAQTFVESGWYSGDGIVPLPVFYLCIILSRHVGLFLHIVVTSKTKMLGTTVAAPCMVLTSFFMEFYKQFNLPWWPERCNVFLVAFTSGIQSAVTHKAMGVPTMLATGYLSNIVESICEVLIGDKKISDLAKLKMPLTNVACILVGAATGCGFDLACRDEPAAFLLTPITILKAMLLVWVERLTSPKLAAAENSLEDQASSSGWMKGKVVFIVFVVACALHSVMVEASKTFDPETGKRIFMYQMESVHVEATLATCVLAFIPCFLDEKKDRAERFWTGKPMVVFSIIGILYAFGDCLSMASGAVGHTLQESGIILTAVLVVCVRGVCQTPFQWILLVILMFSMSAYMVIVPGYVPAYSSNNRIRMAAGLLKVTVSSVGAVLADKYLKVYACEPLHFSLFRIYLARSVAVFLISFTLPIWTNGLFHDWDRLVFAVMVCVIIKRVSCLWIVATLDSVSKNAAECMAVLLIYPCDVAAAWVPREFKDVSLLVVLAVAASSMAYMYSKRLYAEC